MKNQRKKESLILALLECSTAKEAAEKVGISERTLYLWLGDKDFQAQYEEARRRLFEHSMARVASAASGALDVILALMSNKRGKPTVRLRAALAILDLRRQGELEDLHKQLNSIEKLLRKKGLIE